MPLDRMDQCPLTWLPWEWWLGYQIDLAAEAAHEEIRRAALAAYKELHAALNQAQLDLVMNTGRRFAWRAHRSTL